MFAFKAGAYAPVTQTARDDRAEEPCPAVEADGLGRGHFGGMNGLNQREAPHHARSSGSPQARCARWACSATE